jgi:transposase
VPRRQLTLVPSGLLVEQVLPASDRVTIIAAAHQATADCPSCHQPSGRTHSRYERRLRDLPWQGRPVILLLRARRFRCPNPACPRQTFAERVGHVVAAAARRTERLAELQRRIALATGGEAGARLAVRLAMPASPDTLLRLVARTDPAPQPTPRVLGVDDWALRRGHRYGTVLVDLERNKVVDLLPDRQADTLAAWLRRHPGVEIVARDRAGAYADSVRAGAPQARQVADRWHMLRNLGDAMRSIVERYHAVLRRIARQVADEMAARPHHAPVEAPRPTAPERRKRAAFARRQARYMEAERLLTDGLSLPDVAMRRGVDPRTLRRWRELGHAPLWDRRPSGSILDPFRPHLERRWAAGCGNARQLWRELVGLGFAGRPGIVRVWTGRRRKADAYAGVPSPGQVARSRRWKPPSIHKLTRLLTAARGEPSEPDRLLCDRLLAQKPDLAAAVAAARRLAGLLRKEGTSTLVDVLNEVATTPLARFAQGLDRDADAVQNALELPWTTSPVEGQVNRIKTVKRAMYGRAGFDLLRRRVLLAA